ncbi:MAG: molybdopterin molybdotransferase MoeA [Planctomycetota bacterium]|nr:molybdopterin molybdotransferase MoeA [Planctomycetota bacterium]
MIDLEEARKQILARIAPIGSEHVRLEDALGRILSQSVPTRDPIPPFDNTAMDGFVLKYRDTSSASPDHPVTLPVVATIEAGMAPTIPLEDHCAMKIFTGAVIPPGGDSIIPFERCLRYDERTIVIQQPVAQGAHIRRLGEDVEAQGSVLAPGSRITPAAIGLLASVGAAQVQVNRRPRVAIHSSGNELVSIASELQPGQIRNSNLYSLQARVKRWGAIPIARPILRDDLDLIRSGLRETLELKPDAIVTTGGISAGDLDHIRDVAREMGDDVQIRKVSMKPGKPLVDGLIGGVPFFGLPGNPAACLVSFEIFVRPALARMEGRSDGILPQRCGVLKAAKEVPPSDRLRLLRGRATPAADGGPDVIEIPSGQGSHLLGGFAAANCLVIAPASTEVLRPGAQVHYWSLTDEEA